MKRRDFLKLSAGSALATTAMVSFPSVVRAAQTTTETLFDNSSQKYSMSNHYALRVDTNMFVEFDKVSKEFRTLTVMHSGSFDTTFENEINYDIKTVDLKNGFYHIELKTGEITKGSESEIPSDFPFKKPTFIYNPTENILQFMNRDGVMYVALKKFVPPANSGDADCYVTTLLVGYLGMADQGKEMNQLRNLRERVLEPNVLGQKKITNYKSLSQSISNKLKGVANKEEIFNHGVRKAIEPSIKLAEEGKEREAVDLIGDYMIQVDETLS